MFDYPIASYIVAYLRLFPDSLGIITGLTIGNFLGIFLTSWFAVKIKVATLATELTWRHIAGIALLGGIGFTMSVFIANLAFDLPEVITASKLSVLCGSFCAAIADSLRVD